METELTSTTISHICHTEDIKWAPRPDSYYIKVGDPIKWYGICTICNRAVYQSYTADPDINDAATDKDVHHS